MILGRRHPKRKKPEKRILARNRKGEISARSNNPKGVPIRISGEVFSILARKQRAGESWDHFFRRLLNYPQRNGTLEPLTEVWLLPSTGETFHTQAKAKAKSILNGAKTGRAGKFESPIFLREVI